MNKLLIVDDQEMYLKSLVLPLKKKYEIETATNYEDSIKEINNKKIDIVLIDIRLDANDESNTDGLRIVEWIKMNKPDIKVFVMSAYKEFEYAETALNLGAKHFFKKPIDIISLMAILKEKA